MLLYILISTLLFLLGCAKEVQREKIFQGKPYLVVGNCHLKGFVLFTNCDIKPFSIHCMGKEKNLVRDDVFRVTYESGEIDTISRQITIEYGECEGLF